MGQADIGKKKSENHLSPGLKQA